MPCLLRRTARALLVMMVFTSAGASASALPPLPADPIPSVSTGRIESLEVPGTPQVPGRTVRLWLPPGYPQAGPYAVALMFDGQMLFDATITWNGQSWQADETAAALQAAGRTRPFVIVGVPNAGPARHAEYFPQAPYEALPEAFRQALRSGHRPDGPPLFARDVYSDAFSDWLVAAVLPAVEARPGIAGTPDNRVVIGSSMGGLIAMYTVLRHPQAFGGFGAMSTHWPGIFTMEGNPIPAAFQHYVAAHLPAPGRHRLYFDHGDATLDALYPPLQAEIDRIAASQGWAFPAWRSRAFPGAPHTETAWAARLDGVFTFLLPPR
jgi:enterochelin esterase-like enzyme